MRDPRSPQDERADQRASDALNLVLPVLVLTNLPEQIEFGALLLPSVNRLA